MGIDNRIVGMTITELRKRAKMTQLQLAYTLNVSHQAVSKWESGAALPDIQTLLSLTQLFGITMEQLLSGDIPRPEPEEKQEASEKGVTSGLNQWIRDNIPEETRKTINDLTRSAYRTANEFAAKVGNAINAYTADASAPAESDSPETVQPEEPEAEPPCEEAEEDDGAFETLIDECEDDEEALDKEDENVDEENDNSTAFKSFGSMSLEQLIHIAPFMSREKLSRIATQLCEQADWKSLTSLAPFLSKQAIDELARQVASKPANRAILVRLAPFVSKATLYDLILANLSQLNFDDLRPFCPFLSRDMVDELFAYFSTGRLPKELQKKAETNPVADVGNVLQQGLNRLDGVLNGIGSAVCDTIDSLRGKPKSDAPASPTPKPARAPSEFKDRVARAALQAGNWDWLISHYTEIGNPSILLDVALAAIQPENRARTEAMLPVLAQLLKGEDQAAFFGALSDNGDWEVVASLRDTANEASADAVARSACQSNEENAYTVIELYANKLSSDLLEELAEKALADNNWLLINALTDGQDRI